MSTMERKEQLIRERQKFETIIGALEFAEENNESFSDYARTFASCGGSYTHLKKAKQFVRRLLWENREEHANRR